MDNNIFGYKNNSAVSIVIDKVSMTLFYVLNIFEDGSLQSLYVVISPLKVEKKIVWFEICSGRDHSGHP